VPRRKTGLFSFEFIDPEVIKEELKETVKKIEEYEASLGSEGAKFTGVVFIVFNKPSDCFKILKK